jgi:metal-sulfur cluster biosynthetic enzyme
MTEPAPKLNCELRVLDALSKVMDPEMGMSVVELALIRNVDCASDPPEIKMVLTTPFCPYAGALIAEIEAATAGIAKAPFKVTLLAERWNPADAGLDWY